MLAHWRAPPATPARSFSIARPGLFQTGPLSPLPASCWAARNGLEQQMFPRPGSDPNPCKRLAGRYANFNCRYLKIFASAELDPAKACASRRPAALLRRPVRESDDVRPQFKSSHARQLWRPASSLVHEMESSQSKHAPTVLPGWSRFDPSFDHSLLRLVASGLEGQASCRNPGTRAPAMQAAAPLAADGGEATRVGDTATAAAAPTLEVPFKLLRTVAPESAVR